MARKALVFDMDGVLVEVSESYRESIVQTVKLFTGETVTRARIQEYKNQGGWNNDWALSQKIAHDLGVEVPYETVVEEFNKIFFGTNGTGGLILRERWIAEPGLLERLAERFGMAIFTGRLRYEADVTLRRFAVETMFHPLVCADDVANGKPAPDGLDKVREALDGVELLYIGDTVDDARSSRAAGVPFLGIAAPAVSHRDALIGLMRQEGAIAILDDINQLEQVLDA